MPEAAREQERTGLSVIVTEGGLRFVIEAALVDKLEPLAAPLAEVGEENAGALEEKAPVVRLASRLKIDSSAEPRVLISLRGRRAKLAVQAIESVLDLGSSRLISLPVLTRLQSPVFRGVHELGADLVPAIDLDGLLGEDRQ